MFATEFCVVDVDLFGRAVLLWNIDSMLSIAFSDELLLSSAPMVQVFVCIVHRGDCKCTIFHLVSLFSASFILQAPLYTENCQIRPKTKLHFGLRCYRLLLIVPSRTIFEGSIEVLSFCEFAAYRRLHGSYMASNRMMALTVMIHVPNCNSSTWSKPFTRQNCRLSIDHLRLGWVPLFVL